MISDDTKVRARRWLETLSSSDEVAGAMFIEHQQLDRSIVVLIEAVHTGRRPVASFDAFAEMLTAHQSLEELVIFPAFERLVGVGRHGPIAPLRQDHRKIGKRRAMLRELLEGQGALEEAERALISFRALLRSHFRRESMAYQTYGSALDLEALLRATEQPRARSGGGPA